MNGPGDNFPVNIGKENLPFNEEELLTDFRAFIAQKKIGRPFPYLITKNEFERGFSIIARAIEKLDTNQVDIETFSYALDYFTEVEQGIGFNNLNIKGPDEFSALRKKVIDFLQRKNPSNKEELKYFIGIYILLRIPEPSGITALWRNRKKDVYDESSYLESIEIPKAVAYIRKRIS